ncbi:MAG: hypothetical protein F4Y03_05940 [Alphaproteobacteria bacterium]|nr:hypothetical protein [Alphaproteobacteria bacterium]
MATVSTERLRSALERAGVQPDDAAALAEAAARRPLAQRDWLAPLLAAALLGLLGWIALSIHEMNARLGVVETRLIAVEEGQAKLQDGQAKLEAGQAQASAERRALERKVDDLARRPR